MRVTNNLIYSQANQSIGKSNEKILGVQEKISAQTSIVKPSDDPVGASQILMHEGNNQRFKLYDDAMQMATSNLEYQEVALDSLNSSLDDARTLFIQAQNDVNTQTDREAIVMELSLITDSMAELMNSRSADGSYIFAGTDNKGPAFIMGSDGRYQWAGNEGQRFAQISEDMKIPITNSGKELFQDIWTHRTFTSSLESGDVDFSYRVKDLGDFSDFMNKNYDPEDASLNEYQLVTTPVGVDPDTILSTPFDDTGLDSIAESARRRAMYGTPGEFYITNSKGDVMASGEYKVGKPILLGGMEFSLIGEPGARVDFALDKPRRDNVLNEINDVLAILRDVNSTHDERQEAFFRATASVNNAQRAIGEARSSVGARLNVITDREDFSSANQLSNAIAQDRVGGLDVGEAATELSMNEAALTASQKVFARMGNLSLFNQM